MESPLRGWTSKICFVFSFYVKYQVFEYLMLFDGFKLFCFCVII